jgi:hypothetical protein
VADAPDTSVLDAELETSVLEGGGLFCGQLTQEYAINGVTHRWPPGSRLTIGVGFTSLGELSDMDCKDVIVECVKEPAAACNVSFEIVTNPRTANIYLVRNRLDGPSGVLAQMGIPMNPRPDTQLIGEFDDSEAWGVYDNPPNARIDFYRVFLHEFEHALGLGHKPASVREPALIAPIYSPVIRHLQPADIGELVRRYGSPQVAPKPPAAGGKPVNFKGVGEVEQDGKLWRGEIKGTLLRVQ